MNKITLVAFLLFTFPFSMAQSDALYTITFESNWSQAAHPHSSGSLPSGAHWSRLVGATHNNSVTFLEMGELASPGIEDVAELGSNTVFFNEVNAAITAGTADQAINGPDLDTSLGIIEIAGLEVNVDYSYLTLASMIAPSPDWMIAVNSIDLYDDGTNSWIDEIVIDLYPYDAGTDSGPDYSSPNMNTSPADPISSLQGVAPFSSAKIGTLTISFDGILNVQDNNKDQFTISPNPAQDMVTIDSNKSGFASVTLYNTLGKQVKEVRNVAGSLQIDLSELTSGLYLVQVIDTNGNSSIKKLIKR